MTANPTPKTILYINGASDTIWYELLQAALSGIALLNITNRTEALENVQKLQPLAVVVDAVAADNTIKLVAEIHRRHPLTPIIVVTASPTWKRAREYFLAGATDYIRKSLNAEQLRKTFSALLSNA